MKIRNVVVGIVLVAAGAAGGTFYGNYQNDRIVKILVQAGCRDIGAAPEGHELYGIVNHGLRCPSGEFFVTR